MNVLEAISNLIKRNVLSMLLAAHGIGLVLIAIVLYQFVDFLGAAIALFLFVFFSFGLVVQTSFFVRERYSNVIRDIEVSLQNLVGNDFTSGAKEYEDDELRSLTEKIGGLLATTNNNMGKIITTMQNVNDFSNKLHKNTDVLDQTINNQSANCQVVRTAIEEMVYSILGSAELNTKAAQSSETSGMVAKEGGEAVDQTIAKIQKISSVVEESVEKIAQLGKACEEVESMAASVRDIATQTNLLALNAAIEAARAGEHGRGFSVVADEVRSLANNTTDVTTRIVDVVNVIRDGVNETTDLMKQTHSEVTEGIKLVDKAGDALKKIVDETQSVVQMIKEIASASDESAETSTDKTAYHLDQVSFVTSESEIFVNEAVQHMSELKSGLDGWQELTTEIKDLMANLENHKTQGSVFSG